MADQDVDLGPELGSPETLTVVYAVPESPMTRVKSEEEAIREIALHHLRVVIHALPDGPITKETLTKTLDWYISQWNSKPQA